jgi:hypothetical protein
MMKKLLMAATAVLALTGAAHGDEFKPFSTVDVWAIENNENICMSHASYPHNGTLLFFAMNTAGLASITINNQQWSIPEGEYEVRAAVDDRAPAKFTANAEGTSLSWRIALSENNVSMLSKGSVLHVWIGKTSYQYILNGTAAMMAELIRCTAKLTTSANPFGSPQTDPVSTTSNPFKRT